MLHITISIENINILFLLYLTFVRNIVEWIPGNTFNMMMNSRCDFMFIANSHWAFALKDFTFCSWNWLLMSNNNCITSVFGADHRQKNEKEMYSQTIHQRWMVSGEWAPRNQNYWRTNSPFDIYLIVYSHQK